MFVKHIIIDTDAGHDDVMAIAWLLNKPEICIEAVTVCNGLAHVDAGAETIARLFAATGHNIPVYAGHPQAVQGNRSFPATWRAISDSLAQGLSVTKTGQVEPENAVSFLLRRCTAPAEPLHILALGPLTNLALVYRQNPAAFKTIHEITLMGGAFHVPGNVHDYEEFVSPTNLVEWNLFVDPFAVQLVCQSGVPLTFIPLDATNKVRLTAQFVEQFTTLPLNVAGTMVRAILQSIRHRLAGGEYYAWDPLAAVALVEKTILNFKEITFDVVTSGPNAGQTRCAETGRSHARVALDADGSRFFNHFITSLTN
ncbi:MAG TPA: nucleoside hydrolase [bacterium]|nr:nucleoside hydrolase [bacterium]HPN43698.1 nucleoside hydrolase [bacterium]